MLKLFVYLNSLFLLLLVSCQNPFPGYQENSSGIYYKYYKIGEKKEQPKAQDYVDAFVSYKPINDSVFFITKKRFQLNKPLYKADINQCFFMLSEGDSASFILKTKDFFEKTLNSPIPSFLQKQEYFKTDISLIHFLSPQVFKKEKQEFLAWIKDFSLYEKTKLSNYIDDCSQSFSPEDDGIYKMIIKKGNGKKVHKGDTLTLNYEGKFLNDKFFDSTIKRNRTFEYIYGTEWQVIKGMEVAIGKMEEGEKSIFIFPSSVAYGSKGNSNGAIPPFTTLIYNIELISIR